MTRRRTHRQTTPGEHRPDHRIWSVVDAAADRLEALAAELEAERKVRKKLAEDVRYWQPEHGHRCACLTCENLAASDALDKEAT